MKQQVRKILFCTYLSGSSIAGAATGTMYHQQISEREREGESFFVLYSSLAHSSLRSFSPSGQNPRSCGFLMLHLNSPLCVITSLLLYAYKLRTALTKLKCNTINYTVTLLRYNRLINESRVIK